MTQIFDRPNTFAELLDLLSGSREATAGSQPFVASACELDGDQPSEEARQWVVMYDVGHSSLRLIHWKPISADRLVVRLSPPSGEIVQVVVAKVDTRRHGPVYGTLARFFTAPPCPDPGE